MDKSEMLYELCETLMMEIEECNEKIRAAGNKLTAGDVDYIDKLTHALKSIKTTIAMIESDEGYSGWYMPRYFGESGGNMGGGSSNRGGNSNRRGGNSNRGGQSNRGGSSYARGRGRNARRDSMGRYSREDGYSYAEEMDEIVSDIREMMDDLPEDKKRKVERLVNELES